MKKISARQLTTAAAIAALYTVLSLASSFIPTVGGVFQFRVSEALTILPYFTPAAIPGLFIGCLLSNLITGALPYDLVFGSLATLLGAVGTYFLRGHKFLCTLPPVVANMVIIPFVLRYGYGLAMEVGGHDVAIPFYMLTVGAGEVICCCILGTILLNALAKVRGVVFKNED